MAYDKCDVCGKATQPYNSIQIQISLEKGYKCVCLPCYNKDMAKAVGVDFEHVELQPVILKDADGIDHEFHFTVHLQGDNLLLHAFELINKLPAGYEFRIADMLKMGFFLYFQNCMRECIKD